MRLAILFVVSLLVVIAADAQQGTIPYSFRDPSMSGSQGVAAAMMSSTGFAIFEDSDIAVSLEISRTGLSFDLQNISANPIKLDWNECAFVDAVGRSRRVIHSGVRLVDRGAPMATITIPPPAVHSNKLTPVDNIRYSEDSHRWEVSELLPDAYKQFRKNHNALHALAHQWCDTKLFVQRQN
jgi:hypothetical protein